MLHRIERPGIEPVGERIVDQPVRHPQQPRIVHLLQPIALERAEIVGIAEFAAQLFEDLPVAVCAPPSPCSTLDVHVQIGLDAIIVEQRVVDVEQE